jgi:hypothetical protein
MRHLNEGTLRRMYDDAHAVDERARVHLSRCEACRIRLSQIADEARRAAELLQVSGVTVDAERGWRRLQPRLAEPRRRRLLPALDLRWGGGWRKPAVAAVLAAAMVGALSATSLASTLVQLLQPQQIQPVPLGKQDVSSLAPLAGYGDVSWQTEPQTKAAGSAAEAASASGLPALNLPSLPKEVAGQQATYETVTAGQATFTFSAAKAQAEAAKHGRPAPQLPPGTDGSSVVVQSGAGQAVVYGDMAKLRGAAEQGGDPGQAVAGAGSVLAVGEMKAPTVYSTGMSLDQLKQVLLSQPGLTPQAKAAINSLGSPEGTLPIPFPVDKATATPITVQGVKGTMFGDNTGLGAGVMWVRGGVIHVVAGTLTQDQLLSVANGLR